MTVTIYQSSKFHHAHDQYYAEAGGYTLLRLTCGGRTGTPGGAIKTATTSDPGAAPVYRQREKLTAVMQRGVQILGGCAQDVSIEIDGKGRRFGDIKLKGTQGDLLEALRGLAEEMEQHLGPLPERIRDGGYSDLRDLYDDLCHAEGEPVYLSDGVYLDPDGRLFE